MRRLAAALGGWSVLIKAFNRQRALRREREASAVDELQRLGVHSAADAKALLAMPFLFVAASELLGGEDRARAAFTAAICDASPEDAGLDVSELSRAIPPGTADVPLFALRTYSCVMRSVNAVDVRDGIRRVVDIEDTPTTAGFDVTFCAYAEAFRIAGVPAACAIVCSGDEAFIPPAIEPLGLHFERTGTIGGGQQRCDFRFVVGPKPQAPTPQ